MNLKRFFLASYIFLVSFSVFSEDEGLELLYQKIEALEQEIRDLRNILEENSILVDRSLEIQQQRYLDLDSRILELSKINLSTEQVIENSNEIKTPDEERVLFKQALVLFEEERFAEALDVFSEIIISFPNGTYAPDAYFWSGELFLAQEMNEDAKLSYQNVIDQFFDHQRAPDSLYKLAEIYRIEGNKSEALNIYNKVLEVFSESGAAQLAKKSKENLKEESNLVE
ncbi:MAG: tol-pal system protein YbgF [SAR86 cluster bacterium]|nr:tol-pal system protein YbgF [SAR86 cluster bacterium]